MRIQSLGKKNIKFYDLFVKKGPILTNCCLPFINPLFQIDELLYFGGMRFRKLHFRVVLSILPLCNDRFFA